MFAQQMRSAQQECRKRRAETCVSGPKLEHPKAGPPQTTCSEGFLWRAPITGVLFRAPFSTKFFMISILFLIFDVEVALLLPVLCLGGVSLWGPGLGTYFLLVLGVLLAGALYELSTGLLD